MRFYGNKTKLLEFIEKIIKNETNLVPNKTSLMDPFTGTTAVAQHFKTLNYEVHASDFLNLSFVLAKTYVELNEEPKFIRFINKYHLHPIEWLNQVKGYEGFITKNYSPISDGGRQYLSVKNAKKIDSIRNNIDEFYKRNLISELEKYYLITSLLNAINLISNVSGTYGSFLKNWDKRALNKLTLFKPIISFNSRKNTAHLEKAENIIIKNKCDILYLDPPYNSRQYASNYFLPELIAEGWSENKPKIYGYTGMRPYDDQKSDFCSKTKAFSALSKIIQDAQAKYIFLSYNNEGILTKDQILSILSKKGETSHHKFEHKRYRSIGQDGIKSKTIEYLFVVKVKK